MTRSTLLTQAGTAKKKARATARAPSKPAAMKFLVYEDNGGGYHWTIVGASGEPLVQTASFASYAEAKQAARIVHRGASQASFVDRSADTPSADLAARRDERVVRDELDAERWLDEGGSFSSEAVTRWPAPR
jgi:uncharacterized protein YegP (UPF0339 family)